MATKKEKLNYSKFFPDITSYVVLEGYAKGSDDFDVTLKVGNGDERIVLYTTDWYKQDVSFLKAIKESIEKAIEFTEKASKLAKVETKDFNFDFPVVKPKKTVKKKAATK